MSAEQFSMEKLKEALPEMDISAGIAYCGGSSDFFLSMVEEYAHGQPFDELEKFYQDEDWKNYHVLAHSMKSSSLMIGLPGLSEEARHLEEAAKSSDLQYIRQNHQKVMEHYREVLRILSASL